MNPTRTPAEESEADARSYVDAEWRSLSEDERDAIREQQLAELDAMLFDAPAPPAMTDVEVDGYFSDAPW